MAAIDTIDPGRPEPVADGRSVLVVIPTLNEEAHVEACVRSLMEGDPRLAQVRFAVSDGGSADATREIVARLAEEFPNLALVDNPDRLQAAAVNKAVREHRSIDTTLLVRCDAHSIYPANYVMRVADALLRSKAESLVVPMDAVGEETCFQKANAWIVDTPLGSGGSAHRGGRKSGYVDHGHHAGFDLATFTALGGYDETFSHNEDAEYDQRVQMSGGAIYMDADIRLEYAPRPTIGGVARQYYNYGRGRARNLRKHRTLPRLRHLIPVTNLAAIVVSFLGAPIFPWLLAYPAFYASVLLAASAYMAVRHRSACGLLAGVASAVMHSSWAVGYVGQLLFGRPER